MTNAPDRGPSAGRIVVLTVAAFAVAAAVRLWTLRDMGDANPLFNVTVLDEAVYLREAARMRDGLPPTSPSLVSLFWPWLLSCLGATTHWGASCVNVVIGAVTTALAAAGAAKLSRSLAAGAAAGAICALSGALVFQDVTAQIESVTALSVLASVLALVAAARNPTTARLAIAGAAIGVATLARGTNVALLLGVLPALRGVSWRPRAMRAAVLVVAAALPVGAFDTVVGSLPTSGGVNLWLGNGDWSRETLSFGTDEFPMDPDGEAQAVTALASAAEGRALTPPQINAWWTARAVRAMAAQPGATLVHFGKKALLVFYPDDMGGNHDAVLEREFAAPLRVLPVTFAWVLVLGAAGFVLARRSAPGIDAAGLATLGVAGALVVVFPLTRYCAALVPAAAVLVGAGAAALLREDRDRRRSVAAGVTLAALATASFVAGVIRPSNRAEALMNLATASMHTGIGDADAFLRRSAAEDATYPPPLVMLGARAFDAGNFDDALARFEAALGIAWNDRKFVGPARDAVLGRARSLAALGRYADALETADTAARAFAADAEFPATGALIALAMDDVAGARKRLEVARALDPSNERVLEAGRRLGGR